MTKKTKSKGSDYKKFTKLVHQQKKALKKQKKIYRFLINTILDVPKEEPSTPRKQEKKETVPVTPDPGTPIDFYEPKEELDFLPIYFEEPLYSPSIQEEPLTPSTPGLDQVWDFPSPDLYRSQYKYITEEGTSCYLTLEDANIFYEIFNRKDLLSVCKVYYRIVTDMGYVGDYAMERLLSVIHTNNTQDETIDEFLDTTKTNIKNIHELQFNNRVNIPPVGTEEFSHIHQYRIRRGKKPGRTRHDNIKFKTPKITEYVGVVDKVVYDISQCVLNAVGRVLWTHKKTGMVLIVCSYMFEKNCPHTELDVHKFVWIHCRFLLRWRKPKYIYLFPCLIAMDAENNEKKVIHSKKLYEKNLYKQ